MRFFLFNIHFRVITKKKLLKRYEGDIKKGSMKSLIGFWYLYALVITASYAGEIRSFFINPGLSSPLGKKVKGRFKFFVV